MAISAKDVQELRKSTGAGMMDAKKALTEASGDFEAAVQILREKGLAKAAGRSDRENSEGIVVVAQNDEAAALVHLKSETDFAAKSDDFVKLAHELAELVLGQGPEAVSEKAEAIEELKLTVKENIDLLGSPTTQAMAAFENAMPTTDAPITERMKAAGAIPIARTNLPDFGLRVHTDSSLHGLTKNPHHPGRTAGGSSGGEASAIASGMSPLGLGNDIGGSLRNPAHCCGISSIKPSVGVVANASSLPPEDPMLSFQQMAVQGTMARRVADVRASFQVVAGAHPRDPVSLPVTLTSIVEGERLRVAVLAEPPGGATHPEIAAAVRALPPSSARS